MAPDHESHAGKMSADEKARTVFVGNVSLDATKRNVRKLFAEFTAGRVESVRVRSLVNPASHIFGDWLCAGR